LNKSLTTKILKKNKGPIVLRVIACMTNRGSYLLLPLIFGTSINHIANGRYQDAMYIAIIGLIIGLLAKASQVFKTFAWFI